MLRRSFLKLAAAALLHPALRWVPDFELPEPEPITFYVDTWLNLYCSSKRRQGIITPC